MPRLKPTQTLPLFSLNDVFDRKIDLKSYKNNGKILLISFFRNVACPFCNFRIHQLTKKNEQWKNKLDMIFFLESKKEIVLRSTFHRDVSPIPIISDPNKVIYQKYGIENSTLKLLSTALSSINRDIASQSKKMGLNIKSGENPVTTIPADFLVDDNLNILETYYGKNAADHISFENIEAAISKS